MKAPATMKDPLWRRARSLPRVGVVALWTGFWTTAALIVRLVSRCHSVPLALARTVWAPGVLRFLGTRLEVKGVERVDFSNPHLFVANHSSQLDFPVLFAALPVPLRFLAKQELRQVPLVGHYIGAMGMVFIDRRQSESARASIDEMAELLYEGKSLMAFPEGTRSRDGEIRPFKTGAFVAAIKSGVSVVPVHIAGAARVLSASTLVVRPGKVEVSFGEPICTRGLTLGERRQLADRAHARMSDLASGLDTSRDRE